MKTFIITIALLTFASSAATSKVLWWWDWACSNGGTSYTAAIEDDVTRKAYLLFYDCDGSTCIAPLNGPRVEIKIGNLTPPPDFHNMCIQGVSVTSPNTPIIYMFKTSTGESIWFRTPVDQAERVEYMSMWEQESGHLTIVKTPEQQRHYADVLQNALINSYEATLQKYGRTNVTAKTDGSTLTITPIATDASNYVVVENIANSKSVWSGSVSATTTLTLPDGEYDVIGMGGSHALITLPGSSETILW
jgi:hypothetical protein